MDSTQLEFLRTQDWEDLGLKVLNSLVFYARKYGWQQGETMPGGQTPETLALDVISDFWNGVRTYNPKWKLVTQLRNAAKSKISNLYDLKEAKMTERRISSEAIVADGWKEAIDDSSENMISMRDEFSHATDLLLSHPKVAKNRDLKLLVGAIRKGLWETSELASATSLPTSRIHQLKRDLRDVYPEIACQLNQP